MKIVPAIKSIYTWEGVPQVDQEQQLFIKTTTDQVDALWDVLRSRHPYDVPEFLVIPVVDGSEDYLRWVERSVGPTLGVLKSAHAGACRSARCIVKCPVLTR